tara:strand:+ start:438 stop:1280 length:843 start_codon:yes stop_codon:yes gene_type:complete
MKIYSAIYEGAKILKSNYISSAFLDSEILMAEAINKDRKYILLNSHKKLNIKNLQIFKKLIKKRSFRKPIAYLTNKKFFWKSEFIVSKDTLIPRPDTELLIESVLNYSKNKNKLSILDIGIGSGCILLSILKEKKNFYGTGIDINKNTLNICKINAINLNLSNRLRLFKTNIDKFAIGKYDLIVSNPPYINKNKIKYLDKDVAKYEPIVALDGGLDGLSEIRKVINKSSELIKKNGKFILEIGFDQKSRIANLLNKKGFYINSIKKDLANKDRCIICTKI